GVGEVNLGLPHFGFGRDGRNVRRNRVGQRFEFGLIEQFQTRDQQIFVLTKRDGWTPFFPTLRPLARIERGAEQADDDKVFVCHKCLVEHWCGTGSGSDLVPLGCTQSEAPGRYRSLYRTGARQRIKAKHLAIKLQNPSRHFAHSIAEKLSQTTIIVAFQAFSFYHSTCPSLWHAVCHYSSRRERAIASASRNDLSERSFALWQTRSCSRPTLSTKRAARLTSFRPSINWRSTLRRAVSTRPSTPAPTNSWAR